MSAIKGAGNSAVSYNSNALTDYVNTVDLQNVIAELEATHLGSDAMESDAGLPSYQLQLSGDWRATLDGYLGPDSLTGAKRTVVVTFTDGDDDVSYTWTAGGDVGGFITNYNPKSSATGKLEWSATLRLSGLPVRAVA